MGWRGWGADKPESAFMLLILKQGTQAGQYEILGKSKYNMGKGLLTSDSSLGFLYRLVLTEQEGYSVCFLNLNSYKYLCMCKLYAFEWTQCKEPKILRCTQT